MTAREEDNSRAGISREENPGAVPSPVAIIGIGCLFPKAEDARAYWANIKNGVDGITEIPDSHWKPEDYFDADPKSPDRTYARRGGFISPVNFEPLAFGISPNAIEATDTSQLLGLVAATKALEDAGYPPDGDFDRKRVSVMLGVTGTLELVIPLGARLGHPIWRRALADSGVPEDVASEVVDRIGDSYVEWQESSFPGLLGNVVAGRIASRLDLGGTNCTVDAACASALSAMHLATLELAAGRSDMVITGGVDTFNDIFMYMCFSKTPALSPTGAAKPFDKNADGTILGEGLGLVVLKRLDDAERDGDDIYAVICGLGSSSDGKGQAIYAPSSKGQTKALREAYRLADVHPESVELLEAHGTGTKVGDATEVRALCEVYGASGRDDSWCAIGSVKSQIGHTKAAAGAAGIIKAALALKHKVLPPTIRVTEPTELLAPGSSPFYVNTTQRPWLPSRDHPRRAAVSAFGFGGSNFHCVLEEHDPEKTAVDWSGGTQILAFAANDASKLKADLGAVKRELNRDDFIALGARLRREFRSDAPLRLLIVAERASDLDLAIGRALSMLAKDAAGPWSTPDGIFFASGPTPGKLAMIFPGQGSQYVGMGREVACQFPEMLGSLSRANAVAQDGRLSDRIYPHPAFDEETANRQKAELLDTRSAQPAIGAISAGLFEILKSFGLHPDVVAGHSYGELVALHAAGRWDSKTLHKLSALRGELMAGAGRGSMLAVRATADEITRIIEEESLDLVLANKNAPQQNVLSGRTDEILRAEQVMQSRGLTARRLPVSAAFHSPLVAVSRQPFLDALAQVSFHTTDIPVYANSTASLYPDDAASCRKILANQLVSPVEFVSIVETLHDSGVRTFLEVGPGTKLGGLIRSILDGRDLTVVAAESSSGKKSGITDLARCLAELASLGYSIDLAAWEDAGAGAGGGEVTTDDASDGRRPAFSIPLSGANYVKQKPARPASPPRKLESETQTDTRPTRSTHPGPSTPTRLIPEAQKPRTEATLHATAMQNTPAAAPEQGNPESGRPERAIEAPPVTPRHSVKSEVTSIDMNIDTNAAARLLEMTQENLISLQKMQEQAADLHRVFLEGQDRAQQSFLELVREQKNMLLGQVDAGLSPSKSSSSPRPSGAPASSMIEATTAAPMPTRAPAIPKQIPARVEPASIQPAPAQPEDRTPSAAAKKITAEKITAEKISPEKISPEKIAAAPMPAATDDTLTKTLLEVVAEKTGYPTDMLELDMDLDADLGIDSIKRVEILSAIQETMPHLPTIQSEQLGALQSLRDVVDLLASENRAHPSSPAESPPSDATARAPDRAAPSVETAAPESSAAQDALFKIFAEKTGYPRDMLELDMELDADLGIDSIKRVEILSAMQEAIPSAPTIDSERLGQLRTMRDILEIIASSTPGAAEATSTEPTLARPAAIDSGAAIQHQNAVDASQVETTLLAIVAEKTGYPVDMVELDMNLDADLGIDSIKRVEILSACQEAMPDAPTLGSEQLGALQTLREIVDALGSKSGASSPLDAGVLTYDATMAASAPAMNPATKPAAPIESTPKAFAFTAPDSGVQPRPLERRVPVLRRLPDARTRTKRELNPKAPIWIADDGEALAKLIADRLEDRGFETRIIATTELDASLDASQLSPSLGALILLPTARQTSHDELKRLFRLLQLCAPPLRSGENGGQVLAITHLDGGFALEGEGAIEDPISAGLAGIVKTAHHEWPEVSCRVLDMSPEFGHDAAANIAVEELFLEGPIEMGASPHGRLVVELGDTTPGTRPATPLATGDLVIVSGGARGVTAEAAVHLARAHRPHLVLLGRSPVPEAEEEFLRDAQSESDVKNTLIAERAGATPRQISDELKTILAAREARSTLQRIRAEGSECEYRSVDVRNASAVAALITELNRRHGPVRGLVHGAGVLADRLIVDKSAEQFDLVYDTKVIGLDNLLSAMTAADLRVLALFSSSTARFGRKGQVDYAAANEVLNKIAQKFARGNTDCRVVSFNWGPWNGGMVTPALGDLFASEGVQLIPIDAGGAFLVREMSFEGPTEVVVLGAGSTIMDSYSGNGELPAAVSDGDSSSDVDAGSTDTGGAGTSDAASPPGELSNCFELSLDLAAFPFLKSHVIDHRPVLPMAIMVEWLAHGALQQHPGLVFHGFEDLRVLKGVIAEERGPIAIRVLAGKLSKHEAGFVTCAELRSTGKHGRDILHARVRIVLVERLGEKPASKLGATQGSYSKDPEEIYSELLFHGRDLQAIEEVEGCSESGISARVRTAPPPSRWIREPFRGVWLSDPEALDASFQMMILWSFEIAGAGSLPCGAGSYRQYQRSFPKDACRVLIQVTKRSPHSAVADIEYLDANGDIVARMENYECVIDSSLGDAFRRNQLPHEVLP